MKLCKYLLYKDFLEIIKKADWVIIPDAAFISFETISAPFQFIGIVDLAAMEF